MSPVEVDQVNLREVLTLDELKDVTLTSVADKDLIQYDSVSGEWININFARTTIGDSGCSEIGIPGIGTPTWTNQCEMNSLFGSTGQASGGIISDAGSQTVNVAVGTGFIKATDSDTAELLAFDWDASTGISVPTNEIRYIGVKYNGGTPIVDSRTSQNWDYDTEFPLGSVINMNDTLYILNNPWWVTDGITNLIEKSQGLGGYLARDNFVGGLTLGVTATRYPTMTGGTIWGRTNEFEMPAIDLSAPTVTAHSAVFDVNNGSGKGTITASAGTPYTLLHGGQRLIISGTGDNDGTYRVDSVVGDNVITMEGVIAGTDGTEANTVIQETFATYWFETDGTVHETTGLTQYPITHWNDLSGAGVLDTVANNKYYVWWVIINATSNELSFIYPSGEYNSAARAEAEAVPSHIPGIWYLEGMMIGRIIFKTGTDIPLEVQSVFETTFTASLAADHGNLTGLSDDDHTQYILHSLADAANDFLVASAADTYVKKTLAETGAILETDIDHGNLQGLDTGADHSYIDQDVTIGSGPAFTSIQLTTPVLGTPTSGTLTNCTFPTLNQNTTGSSASCTGNAATATILATTRTIGGTSFDGSANIKIGALNSTNIDATTSAELLGVISDETGTGKLVFATSPTFVTPLLGTPTSGTLNSCTNTEWDAAYSHISADGSSHTYIDQSVVSGATPTFTGTNITGVPAASILAGTFGTGNYGITGILSVTSGEPASPYAGISLISGAAGDFTSYGLGTAAVYHNWAVAGSTDDFITGTTQYDLIMAHTNATNYHIGRLATRIDATFDGSGDLTLFGSLTAISITDGTYTSDGSGNFSGVGTIGCGAITSTGDITSTKNGAALTLDVMKFSDYASQCVFEKTAAGAGYWHFGTLDARTVARTNNLFIWGLGAVDAATNYERMVIGFTTTDTDRFKIGTSADGTGSVRPLELLTGTNTGQLYLNTDGSIDMAGALGCGAITSTEESPTLTLADNRSLSAPDWNDAIIGDIDFYTSDGSGGGAGAVSRIRSVVDVDGTNDPNCALAFWTGDTAAFAERVRISSAGYVGIDTTDPISPLEIRGAADVPPLTIRCPRATDSYTGIIFSTYVGTADNKKGGIFFKRDGDDGSMRGDMIFALNNEASAANVDDGDAVMTLLRDGNVGIGTVSPTEKLHIYESIATRNAKFDSMYIETYSSAGAPYGYGSSSGSGFGTGITFRGRTFNSATIRDLARVGYYIQDNSTDTTYGTAMVFDTINTASGALVEAMRIDYKGDIGIGLVDPDSKLEVAGSFKATGATSGTNLGGSIEIEDAVAANAGDVKIAGGTSIDSNDSGHVYIDGGNGPNEGNILLCTAYGLVGIGPAVNPTQPLEVNGNAQVNGEMMGTKQILQFSREDANDVYGTVATFTDYSSVRTTTAKGFTAMRAGSVTGISINYDITAEVLDSSTAIQVFVNGVSVWQNTLTGSGTIASNQEEYFTQARDTDTFSAGDTITVVLFGIGAGGTNATFDNTIIALELYSDA